ncbi:MAG: 3-methyl-2-oxobutanoate hydroxymethyltransferase [Dehalococcoidia bacterium]|nr:3-methyl-2-oxobutanoate hydroxymethyltransferase [Dehalococcoidia bacterium]
MRLTIQDIKQMKQRGDHIAMLTAYDYTTAKLVEGAGVPIILVGDSLGNTMLGYESTIPVTMEEMLHHTRAVVRGTQRALVVGDMPFMSFQVDDKEAVRNAGRFLQEGGAQAVKLEGGGPVLAAVRRMVEVGIPVMGHLGLTPQSINQLGGYKVQGKTPEAATRMVEDALALEKAGVFSLVLECVPTPLAKLITERLSVPTIGIGAGPFCDGQVQVVHDMLGLFTDFTPKHAKRYAELGEAIKQAVAAYVREVSEGSFPTDKQSYSMDESLLEALYGAPTQKR